MVVSIVNSKGLPLFKYHQDVIPVALRAPLKRCHRSGIGANRTQLTNLFFRFDDCDRSQEGSQFCKGFGGIGGILRWRVDFAEMDESNYEDDEDWGEGF